MLKKSLIWGSLLLLVGALVFMGCPSPTSSDDTGPGEESGGTTGGTGGGTNTNTPTAGPQDLTSPLTAVNFKYYLAKEGASYNILPGGLTISEAGEFFVPSDVKFKFLGDLTLQNGSVIIFEDAASVEGDKKIKATASSVTLIADQAVITKIGGGSNVTGIPFTAGDIKPSETNIAVKGNVTITTGATTGTNILNTALSSNLYVVGELTVDAAVTATAINVFGNAKVGAVISTAPLKVYGNLTYTAALTTTNAVTVTGDLDFGTNALTTTNTGDIEVIGKLKGNANLTPSGKVKAGTLDLTGNFATSATTDALIVTGAATINGNVSGTGAAIFTFNGTTKITGTFTPGAANTVIAGEGKVTLEGALGDTSTNTVIIKNIGGVTLTQPTTIAANFKVTKATITGDTTDGVTIKSTNSSAVELKTGASIVITEGPIVFGSGANTITFTKTTLDVGTYTATATGLTLGSATTLTVNEGGTATIAGAGVLTFDDTIASILVLEPNATISVLAATGDITGSARTKVTLLVADSGTPTAGTNKAVSAVGTAWKVTTAGSFDGGGAATVTLGKIKFVLANVTTATDGANADTDAAGSLTAGPGTALTLAGKP